MKRFAAAAFAILFARIACAESVTVRVAETVTIEIAGTTAAYAVDPAIADVTTASGGRVTITGRSAGTTQIIAITAGGTRAYLVTIAPPVAQRLPAALATNAPIARADVRYAGGAHQIQSAFDVFTTDGERRSQFHLLNVHYLADSFGRSTNAIPSIYYRTTSAHRELTLFDDIIDLSPLTVRSTQVRGVHLLDGPLELHAGYAASTMYEDLFLPADKRWMASAGYGIDRGHFRWIPSAYAFLSEPRGTAAKRGAVASLAAEYRDGDTLLARGEMAASRGVAGSGEVRYQTERDQLRGRLFYKPNDFPTLGLSDLPGVHGEIDWNRRATQRLSVDSYATFDRTKIAAFDQSVAVSNVAMRYALTPHVSVLTGADSSVVRSGTNASIRTIGIPAGVAYDAQRFGAAASYRLLDNSQTSRLGDTLRLSGRAGSGGFTVNAWVERQRRAPSLDLIFHDTPGLELALLRLGITVRTPEDLARVLRDNAALINLGYIDGVTVNLTPRRVQSGIDAAFNSADTRNQLRLHAVVDRSEGVASTQNSMLATLSYTRRLMVSTDIYASYSRWRTSFALRTVDGSAVEAGVRHRFDGLPQFLQRAGTIEGVVFLDPQQRGVADPTTTTPLEGIVVMLDDTRSTRTEKTGAYAFRDVPPGRHRVSAKAGASKPAYFTTPSTAELNAPGRADFGLVWSPARIIGRVASDANLGIAGAVINARTTKGADMSATTDSEGGFVLAGPAGEYTIDLAAESLPAGYVFRGAKRVVNAPADQPLTVAFQVEALRSVSGTVSGGPAEIRIEPLGLTVTSDTAGGFVFRSLPPGTFTITARRGGRVASSTVTVPVEPAVLNTSLTFAETAPPAAAAVVAPQNVPAAVRAFFVQLGAFSEARNAEQLVERIARTGTRAESTKTGQLILVRVGPYPSRAEAAKTIAQLRQKGFDAIVTR
ncbi:MAG: SPOR domain-containing protein [Acidobacteria bacterium]|nr:SPOR domain-containing protein [Acidobacteriota bacterium]MBV9185045.1 SPOR domain-containing protein [Acidobacteriota bacterium]